MALKMKSRLALVGLTAMLAGCQSFPVVEADLRSWGFGGFSTAGASRSARPAPDANGIVTYPTYQVAIARQGDTVTTIGQRIGIAPAELAKHNAIDANTVLNPGAVVALPRRVATSGQAATTTPSASGSVRDPFAGQGIAQPNVPGLNKTTTATSPKSPASAAAAPKQHRVETGETAWSIARKYNISVQDLSSLNGLTSAATLRIGQILLIPQPVSGAQKLATTAPGAGSPTPQPPSASQPLPREATAPSSRPAPKSAAPDLGQTRTAASGSGKFQMPVAGSITRAYSKGTNDGIDISASPGSTVKAASGGTVAAITRDVDQVPIVVIRHSGDLLTVYAGLSNVSVQKGDKVGAGQAIGKSGSRGVVHFEVRRGFESVNPDDYLG